MSIWCKFGLHSFTIEKQRVENFSIDSNNSALIENITIRYCINCDRIEKLENATVYHPTRWVTVGSLNEFKTVFIDWDHFERRYKLQRILNK